MPKANFIPSRDGFHFANKFVNNIIGNTITTAGRCGGMAYASLDYYYAGIPIPTVISSLSPFSSQFGIDDFSNSTTPGVPNDGTPLADNIYSRLMDSFLLYGTQFINWNMMPDYCNSWAEKLLYGGKGVVDRTKTDEFTKLMGYIDNGVPVVIGLINTSGGLAQSHQVVAFGYEYDQNSNSMVVYVYDNNYPDIDTVTLNSTIDGTNPHWNEQSGGGEIWRGFFVQDSYGPKSPPFRDISISSGISITGNVPIGDYFDCQYTVTNEGPYPAHLQFLYLSLIGPNGENFDALLGQDNNQGVLTLQPGQTRTIDKPNNTFGIDIGTMSNILYPGSYTIQTKCYTLQSQWITNVPVDGGKRNIVTFEILPPNVFVYINQINNAVPLIQNDGSGAYKIQFSATPNGFAGTVSYQWKVDAGTPNELSANGNPVNLTVFLGPRGGPFQYNHTISIEASDGVDTAVTSYSVTLPQPSESLVVDYADSHIAVAQITPFNGTRVTGYIVTVAYDKILVESNVTGLIGNITYYWNSSPSAQLQQSSDGSRSWMTIQPNGDPTKLASYDNIIIDVSVLAVDQIGQAVTADTYVQPEHSGFHAFYLPPLVPIYPPQPIHFPHRPWMTIIRRESKISLVPRKRLPAIKPPLPIPSLSSLIDGGKQIEMVFPRINMSEISEIKLARKPNKNFRIKIKPHTIEEKQLRNKRA